MDGPVLKEHRGVVYRLVPGNRSRARRLAALAGATRFVWNEMLDQQEQLRQCARMCGGKAPSVSFFTLCKGFKELRDSSTASWLQTMAAAPVRYALKHQAHAWKRYFDGTGGRPRFKRKGDGDSVTIPQDVRIVDGRLKVPRIGWMALRRRGGDPHPNGRPVQATIKRVCGKWTCSVLYEIDAPERPDDGRVTGIDRNAGQVTAFDGREARLLHAPDEKRVEARRKRYQRRMARQVKGSNRRERTRQRLAHLSRRIACRRHDWRHKVSRQFAGGTVVVEKLNVTTMTASAKGTVEEPGKNVRGKSGLNRVISDTGWGVIAGFLRYKAPRFVEVDARNTSRGCSSCGHVAADSRPTRDRFRCVACGHGEHADVNAAKNIRRRGLARLHGEERSHLATPGTREMDRGVAARAVNRSV